jgi:hypothetical protein
MPKPRRPRPRSPLLPVTPHPHRAQKHRQQTIVGAVLPSLAALAAVPMLLSHLGMEGFGIFSMQVAAQFFFGLSDLRHRACGGAAVLRAAVSRARPAGYGRTGSDSATARCWPAPSWQRACWSPRGCGLASCPDRCPRPGAVQRTDVRGARRMMLVSQTATRGLLEAQQRFLLANLIRGPAAAAIFLAPLVAFAPPHQPHLRRRGDLRHPTADCRVLFPRLPRRKRKSRVRGKTCASCARLPAQGGLAGGDPTCCPC